MLGLEADQPDDIIGQYGEEKRNTNGVEMLKFLENSEMKTLNDRARKPEAQWTWTRKYKDESCLLYTSPSPRDA